MSSELLIKQNALILLGVQPIKSLADETDQNTILQARYPVLYKSFMSETLWNFTIKTVQLTRDVSSPVGRFKYQFCLPSDCVSDGVIAAYPSGSQGTQHTLDFVVQEGYVKSDKDDIWIDYQAEVDEGDLPDYVVDVLCHMLAADIAQVMSDNETLTRILLVKSEEMLKRAIRRNAKQAPPNNLITSFPLVDAHHGNRTT